MDNLPIDAALQETIPQQVKRTARVMNVIVDYEHENVRVMIEKGYLTGEDFTRVGPLAQHVFGDEPDTTDAAGKPVAGKKWWTLYLGTASERAHLNVVKTVLHNKGIL